MATPVIQIGNVSGAIYQVEQPFHLNPDGSAQAVLTFKQSTSGSITIPAYLSAHPNNSALLCYETDVNYEPGGIAVVTSTYRGVYASDVSGLSQFEYNRTVTEAPIETHPKFSYPPDSPPVTADDINAIEIALQNNTKLSDDHSDIAKLLYSKKRVGIESYLRPGANFKKTYVSTSIPSASANVGTIQTPPSPCPAAPSPQNFLYVGQSWTKVAGVVTIHEEYQLSGHGPWDTDLYNT